MFEASCLMYMYVETPLHAGTGRGLAAVDLPVQRERVTGYPLVQASGIKGKVRAATHLLIKQRDRQNGDVIWKTVFGPETSGAPDHAGALSPGDARLLLFPVRSLAGVFAWITSRDVLARFFRDAAAARHRLEVDEDGKTVPLQLPVQTGADTALVSPGSTVVAGGMVVLEEFSFTPREDRAVLNIARWLAANVLPTGAEYEYWRSKLLSGLVVLPESAFRDFALYATEVATRVRLDRETKTVEEGGLWTEESLPTDTILYVPLHATRARSYQKGGGRVPGIPDSWYEGHGAADILEYVKDLGLTRVQLGGDETVGRGMVHLRFGEVHHA
ncbi:MAG: type III-B CRISPR module RAMP protein Cmr4 [Bacillota bacterium]|nr:type III-B CRISPR module RAMP protein Cmr4 [Bacillota bacterium]